MTARLGVRARLLLAFFGISIFAVLGAGASMYSFLKAGDALDRITLYRVPATIASQQLSRQAERIVAIAPSLLTVNTTQQHEQMSQHITTELAGLHAQLTVLTDLDVNSDSLILIETLVDRLSMNLSTVDSMIINNLVLVERRKELLRDLRFTDISSRRLLAPGLLVMDAKLAEIRRALQNSSDVGRQSFGEIDHLTRSIISLAPLQGVQAEVSSINDMLIKASSTYSQADLGVLLYPLRRSLGRLEKLLASIESDLATRLHPRMAEFREYTDGKNSILNARSMELRHLDLMQTLLDQNVEISTQLTNSVDLLVSRAHSDILNATGEALSVQRTSTMVMIIVVVLSLVCSALIVWLYVGRNLIARLTGLNDSMLAIANGDLKARIPTGGTDEINDMARALLVFRDTALVVRETNLREIQQARQRLTDAIESIAEGFSLYDAEDRLVLCNSHYCDIYPGIASVMVPGTPFETVIRSAAETGLIKGAKNNIDAWVTKRLALYHDAKGAHLQQQSDGRCIQIHECKTADGGTVAVYSDITALVEQSEQLEAWNKELENRVTAQVEELQHVEQLKRFFPPQLADAIVSDENNGILEDHRSEVTVIFCDLRGFTEFSSLSDPEEEMRVLREYHAVVCPLIFEYGATLEHFAGDGVMSFLNDPLPCRDHIRRAIEMANAMRSGMKKQRKKWLDREVDLGFGVGIGTGYATMGRIGIPELFHYAAIGSVANLASRLCDEARDGQILVTKRVFSSTEGIFGIEPVGELSLKGFLKPVTTYNILETGGKSKPSHAA
ncbi:MAG: HAMP domain-containing protein [Xanthomonadales bacterium]|nr:HAMP domain-containing protein [Xanthomonadales bacterium]